MYKDRVYLYTVIQADNWSCIVLDKLNVLMVCAVASSPMRAVKSSLVEDGLDNQGIKALQKVNKTALKATLNHRKNITLDIDASEVIGLERF
jgi:hypothetical protein